MLKRTSLDRKGAGHWQPAAASVARVAGRAGLTWLAIGALHAQTLEAPFARISGTNAIFTETFESDAAACGDYDGDGSLDLFVGNNRARNSLFHNNGDGSFTKVTNSPIGSLSTEDPHSGAWGDYDNDGALDLVVGQLYGSTNPIFRNLGSAGFELANENAGDAASKTGVSVSVSWADYDRDGLLDLFVANGALLQPENDLLYHNEGGGRFRLVQSTPLTAQSLQSTQGAWGDFDGDGDLDLLVTHDGDAPNALFQNDGHGQFSEVTKQAGLGDIGPSVGAAWGDMDNDGDLDLIVTNFRASGLTLKNFFYRNDGNGTFTRITDGPIATDTGYFLSCAWVDYDNDGWLDLFLTGYSMTGGKNRLYHNDGNGRFTKVVTGRLVTDTAYSTGCAWGDYDQDGFVDVFVANGGIGGAQRNGLYRNLGNSNAWVKVRCVGTRSNRSAIGTTIRLQATVHGRVMRQMRQIIGSEGWLSFNALEAAFGLGDATAVELLRVKWPSGLVQEFKDIPAKQAVTLVEGSGLESRGAKLAIERVGETVHLSWSSREYLLERTASLGEPAWEVVPAVAEMSFDLPLQTPGFFRLKLR